MEQIDFLLRLLAAAVASAVIGFEREMHDKPAGLRTNMLIGVGAALFTIVSIRMAGTAYDPARVSAQVVTGVGFLGAGVILHKQGGVTGLTTAAVVWAVASIGLAFGAGYFVLGGQATVLVLAVVFILGKAENAIRKSYIGLRLTVTLSPDENALNDVKTILEKANIPLSTLRLGKRNGRISATLSVSGGRGKLDEMLRTLVESEAVDECSWE